MPTGGRAIEDLRWGVLGTAGIARTVIAGIRAAGAGHVQAVASRDAAKGRAWADDLGIPLSFGGYAELLDSGAVDLIYNPLPNTLHAEWTVRALEAGLPVLCEKPLALHASEGRSIADAARRAGLPVAEAFMDRFHPVFDAVRAAIARGVIGRPSTMRSVFTFLQDEDAATPTSPSLGGGSLRDVGCYSVSLSRLLAGAEPIRATAVERRDQVDWTMVGILEFPGPFLAQFECSIENHERHEAEITGTDGTIRFPDPWFPGTESAHWILRKGDREERFEVPGADPYGLETLDFARAVATGTAPRWPISDAVAGLAAMDALFEAARSGRTMRVAPA